MTTQPEDGGRGSPFLTRVVLKDYKSIASCDVRLSPFTVLVGPNGAGKSNWLDALRFVADATKNSLEYALRDRGGIKEVRRRSRGHPRHFSMRLEMNLPDGGQASYGFRVGTSSRETVQVRNEHCKIINANAPEKNCHYTVTDGKLTDGDPELHAAIAPDRLYLNVVSGLPEFRGLYDSLTHMGFYNFSPDRIRDLQDPDPGEMLLRDGGNLASILARISAATPATQQRIEAYLGSVVPGLKGVAVKHLGPKETLDFRQEVPGDENPWSFLAANMSDGTLRVLGVLVALFQSDPRVGGKRVPLVGIEEPEIALHPGAAAVLVDALLEASEHVQVIVTSHSPDLLDSSEITSDSILAVVANKGQTQIGPVDQASREALQKRLYTPGELLRMDQLTPCPQEPPGEPTEPGLFDGES